MFSFIVYVYLQAIVYFLNSLIVILSYDVQVFLINFYTNLFQYLLQLIHFFTLQECGLYICNEKWSSENVRHYYNVALLVLQYCIPFAVLLFTYVNIGVVVWGKRTPGEAQNSRDVRMAKSKRKVIFSINYDFHICHALFRYLQMIKMMVTVVIAFTVCWLPYNILLVSVLYIYYAYMFLL